MNINKRLIGVIFIFLIFFSAQLFAQEQEKIEIVKLPLGTVFKFKSKVININEIIQITSSNPNSQKEMVIAKKNYSMMTLFSVIGGALIGWPIGTQLGGGEPQWELAGIGAGCVLIAIPFQIGYTNHTKKAIDEYYSYNQSPIKKNQLQFAIRPNSVNFTYNF